MTIDAVDTVALAVANDVRATEGSTAREVRRGVLEMLPMLVGYAPFAMIIGAAIAQADNPAAGWAGIWLVLGGSAHLATLRALDAGTAVLAVVAGLLVNARLLLYSASMASSWRRQPRWFRFVGAALLIDPTWAAAQRRAAEPGSDDDHRAYYLGASIILAAGWCLMITVGMLVGARWTSGLGLEVALPLCLAALIGPRLCDTPARVTAIVAAVAAVATTMWPAGTGILVAVAAGAAVGAWFPAPTDTEEASR